MNSSRSESSTCERPCLRGRGEAARRPYRLVGRAGEGSHEWVVVYTNDAHQLNDVERRVFPPLPWPEPRELQ